MINKLKYESLSAEIINMNMLLEEARKYKDYVSIMQFEDRIKEVAEELLKVEVGNTKAGVALFFSGKSVFGSRGIKVEFSGKILKEFQDIVSKVNARYVVGDLGSRGIIANTNASNLMLTSIAKGSFGFILEEISNQEEAIDTTLKIILDHVIEYIIYIGSEDEGLYNSILEKLDGRVLLSMKEFFTTLEQNKSNIRLVEGERDISLDEKYIKRAKERTESIELNEKEDNIFGLIQGILPGHRKFEMVLTNGDLIYGTIDESVIKQIEDYHNKNIKVENENWRTKMLVRTIKPLNHKEKTIYTLLELIDSM